MHPGHRIDALALGRVAGAMISHEPVHGVAAGAQVGRAVDGDSRPVRRAVVAAHVRVVGPKPATADTYKIRGVGVDVVIRVIVEAALSPTSDSVKRRLVIGVA